VDECTVEYLVRSASILPSSPFGLLTMMALMGKTTSRVCTGGICARDDEAGAFKRSVLVSESVDLLVEGNPHNGIGLVERG